MDGVLVINKPKDYTSHDVVAIIRKTINQKQCGHIGTLDPNATGVLPILIGKATKISKYLMEHNKTYIATLKLGEQKDTADALGITINKTEIPNLLEKEIVSALKNFEGEIMQIPPIYSAIKINGKKLYEYARKGEKIEVPPRKIDISYIKLIKYEKNDGEIIFEVKCSKGTYIRALCEDVAKKLGTYRISERLNKNGS